jgi:hypothetical protein
VKRNRLFAPSLAGLLAAISIGEASMITIAAKEIAEALRRGGVPLTSAITEESPPARIRSKATTATADAAVAVAVFGSSKERYEARLRSIKSCPDCSRAAQCGPILVEFTGPYESAEAHSRAAYEILKTQYGCE